MIDRHRYSTPFFYTPHIDHPIACLPTHCGADNPLIAYGEYRMWWLNTNYGARLEPAKAQLRA